MKHHSVKKGTMKNSLLILLLAFSATAFANTPGKHSVSLSWTASTTPGVTYNLYRGTAANVCSGTPTPLATGISGTTFTDSTAALNTTYFYNVSAVGTGGESACDGEVTVQVPDITTAPPSGLSKTVN
jgi:fibronectin type 3 domain-containing protein